MTEMDRLWRDEQVRRYLTQDRESTMTIRQVRETVHALGLDCSYNSATTEFRVNLRIADGGTADTAYYTTDRQDACDTALAMARHRDGRDTTPQPTA